MLPPLTIHTTYYIMKQGLLPKVDTLSGLERTQMLLPFQLGISENVFVRIHAEQILKKRNHFVVDLLAWHWRTIKAQNLIRK